MYQKKISLKKKWKNKIKRLFKIKYIKFSNLWINKKNNRKLKNHQKKIKRFNKQIVGKKQLKVQIKIDKKIKKKRF